MIRVSMTEGLHWNPRNGSYLDCQEKVLNYFFSCFGVLLACLLRGSFCLFGYNWHVCLCPHATCNPVPQRPKKGMESSGTVMIVNIHHKLSNKMAVGGKYSRSSYSRLSVISGNALKQTSSSNLSKLLDEELGSHNSRFSLNLFLLQKKRLVTEYMSNNLPL